MRIILKYLIAVFLFALAINGTYAQTNYKVSVFRAAPGELLELIEEIKNRSKQYEKQFGNAPTSIRHSQGDHWDIMVIETIDQASNQNRNNVFTPDFGDPFYGLTASHESFRAYSEHPELIERMLAEADYFHVEMFVSLPGLFLLVINRTHGFLDLLQISIYNIQPITLAK